MTERELIMLGVGAAMGYCFCFFVSLLRRPYEEDDAAEEERALQREKDPADWWKDCE